MTVKDKVGRRRYVVFRVSSCIAENPRKEVERIISNIRRDLRSVHLIQLKNGFGIVRVLHFEVENAVTALNGAHPHLSMETIATAGTVKKAREIIAKKKGGNAGVRN
ncbi:MAG: hypothetical protein N3F63_05240 [Thermoplasmata archaeon]|nr:hypothetical protein [Thermoplasmata archaeon]